MTRSLICTFLIYCCFVECLWAQTDEKEATNSAAETRIDNDAEEVFTGIIEESSSTESSAVERATKPVASWVEERLQKSSLLQPSTYSRDRPEQPAGERTLREAILLAREQFSGAVLSAERMSDEERKWFSIKILSQQGIVRIIDVDAEVQKPTQKSEHTEENTE